MIEDCAYSAIVYAGTVPGADTNAYVLFSTASLTGRALMQGAEVHRLRCDIAGTQSGTFNLYKSRNGGTTWRLVATQAAALTSAASVIFDQVIEPYYDFKLEWANGGVAQAYFEADLAVLPQRQTSDVSGFVPPPPPDPNFVISGIGNQVVSGPDNVISGN